MVVAAVAPICGRPLCIVLFDLARANVNVAKLAVANDLVQLDLRSVQLIVACGWRRIVTLLFAKANLGVVFAEHWFADGRILGRGVRVIRGGQRIVATELFVCR